MKIAIIGAGNVAWHLAQALAAAGNTIAGFYSRTLSSAEELLQKIPHARLLTSLDLTGQDVDLVLIAVPDAALATVAAQLQVQSGTVVAHTSGSQPMAALESITGAQPGVFYPLQTFSKSSPVNLQTVPLLLEAKTEAALQQLQEVAQSISQQVEIVNSVARKQLHLAAVFACNFTNHLLGISQELLEEANLPKNLLQPLLQETIAKAASHNPFSVQTGPAVRHDLNVVEEHLRALEAKPTYQQLYLQLTKSIQAKATVSEKK